MMKQLRKIPQQNKVLRNVEKFSLSQDLQGFFLKKKVSQQMFKYSKFRIMIEGNWSKYFRIKAKCRRLQKQIAISYLAI